MYVMFTSLSFFKYKQLANGLMSLVQVTTALKSSAEKINLKLYMLNDLKAKFCHFGFTKLIVVYTLSQNPNQ